MTTLARARGRAAPGGRPIAAVRSLSVVRRLPSTLHVTVDQRRPVAVLVAGKRRLAVAGDGTVLPRVATDKLPTLPVGAVPRDGRLGRRAARPRCGCWAARPTSCGRCSTGSSRPRDGVRRRAAGRAGDPVRRADRLRGKWAAATRLLADARRRGRATIDVRLPERPSPRSSRPRWRRTATGAQAMGPPGRPAQRRRPDRGPSTADRSPPPCPTRRTEGPDPQP